MADAIFEDPRLAAVYDPLDPDRSDLEVYADMAVELGADDVLDVGCGTGTLAIMLAERGIRVTGVDPAQASLDVARAKPRADGVTWIHGDVTTLPPLACDVAFMTGNVAQVFLTDDAWLATLRGIHAALRPGGRLVFETRDPAREAWRDWHRDATYQRVEIPGIGHVEDWTEVTAVDLPFVTFDSFVRFEDGGELIGSTSTLRFRTRDEVEASLATTGFELDEVRDAPDRPGRELVFVARRPVARRREGARHAVRRPTPRRG
jgi:SAM-dependent methyltransferase